jgi:hypothetical protein
LTDPALTSAPFKKSRFGIFLDGMKPNPTTLKDEEEEQHEEELEEVSLLQS